MDQNRICLRQTSRIYNPKEGYNYIASDYQSWHWYQFWKIYETPIVKDWLFGLNLGIGLDAGSGAGPYLEIINDMGNNYIAMDLSIKMLETNNKKNPILCNNGRSYKMVGDIRKTLFPNNYFTWLLCTRVLSHIDNLHVVVNEFSRILKSKGSCLITDIHPLHPYEHTSIPNYINKITINTYKHPIKKIMNIISRNSLLKIIRFREYFLEDLHPKPDQNLFKKLYRSFKVPIFYVFWLTKK